MCPWVPCYPAKAEEAWEGLGVSKWAEGNGLVLSALSLSKVPVGKKVGDHCSKPTS